MKTNPINLLGNYEYPNGSSVLDQIANMELPRLTNPATRYGPLIDDPYWETFFVRPEFYSLVNAHKLPTEHYELFHQLDVLCAPFIEQFNMTDWAIKIPMLIEITHTPVAHHVDVPLRDVVMNWYPFENYGHEIYFETGDMVVPKKGDLFMFDVGVRHWTKHPLPGTVSFMSMSLRRKLKP